jgi:PAS domain S-box-containing protein
MTTDSQGIITDVNQQMGALTGCTRDELIGAPFKKYFTEPERAEASIRQVLTEGKVTNYELTARARDGKETVVSYNAIILYDRDRKVQGVFAAARDVTEFKRFEHMLQESNEQLRKLEELRDNLVHMVVHDMRTPLTVIYGFLQLLAALEGERLSEEGREFVRIALASTEELVEMVSSLLDVSKMEAGEMKLNLTECDLTAIAGQALGKVEPLKGDRQLVLRDTDVPVTVTADAEIVARVFQNLLGNALKYTPDGGQVTVDVESSADGVRVLVQDTGSGIPPEYRERIFEKFGQVENPTNRQRYSTGIGLTFCKLAVEAHGGQIGVNSEEGRGSTFWFTLPWRGPAPKAP